VCYALVKRVWYWREQVLVGCAVIVPATPRLVRQTFERLGATYVKLGQFVASSPSLFPADYVNEFQHCLDKTKALPFKDIKKVLESELKQPLDSIFLVY
jgi:aarF domain-containing kinase